MTNPDFLALETEAVYHILHLYSQCKFIEICTEDSCYNKHWYKKTFHYNKVILPVSKFQIFIVQWKPRYKEVGYKQKPSL